jgi:hypothetical protein
VDEDDVRGCRSLAAVRRSLDSLRSLGIRRSLGMTAGSLRALTIRAVVHVAAHAHTGDDVPYGMEHDVVA